MRVDSAAKLACNSRTPIATSSAAAETPQFSIVRTPTSATAAMIAPAITSHSPPPAAGTASLRPVSPRGRRGWSATVRLRETGSRRRTRCAARAVSPRGDQNAPEQAGARSESRATTVARDSPVIRLLPPPFARPKSAAQARAGAAARSAEVPRRPPALSARSPSARQAVAPSPAATAAGAGHIQPSRRRADPTLARRARLASGRHRSRTSSIQPGTVSLAGP